MRIHFTKTIFSLCCLVASSSFIMGCDEDEDPFEEIDKLRAIGVSSTPVSSPFSTAEAPQVTSLVIHALVPTGSTITATPFLDEDSKFSLPLPVSIVEGSVKTTEYHGFDHVTVNALVPIPLESSVPKSPNVSFTRLRYGVTLQDQNGDEEVVVGTLLAYPPGASELAYKNHTVEITSPAAGVVSGEEVDVKAKITKAFEETSRVSWYTSSGKFKNRRALETSWESDANGEQTLFLTVRGTKTGTFSFTAIKVTKN